jgi:hypothetical protein
MRPLSSPLRLAGPTESSFYSKTPPSSAREARLGLAFATQKYADIYA